MVRVLAAIAVLVGVLSAAAPPGVASGPDPPTVPATTVGGPALATSGLVLDAPSGVPKPPKMPNASWLLADLDTGKVLAARAPHARYRPASTMKVLTALVLLPQITPDSRHRVVAADVRVDGSRVGLVAGRTYTGRDLFNALLMASGNDAAYALARIGGGRDHVVGEMADEAARLGALDTTPKDPAGLDAPGERTSAYDLALIARAAMERADFRAYVSRTQATLPGYRNRAKGPTHFAIGNHNTLLYNYPGTIGVKNGYTIKAHHTLVTAVRRGGHTYLVTQLDGSTRSWRPTAALYDWAFRYGDRLHAVGHLVTPAEMAQARADQATQATAATDVPPPGPAAAPPTGATAVLAIAPAGSSRRWVEAGAAATAAVLLMSLLILRRRRPRRERSRGRALGEPQPVGGSRRRSGRHRAR